MQKLTNSARNKFAACHRAYQLFYVQGKRPVIPSDALGFGTAMHSLLEGVWGGSSSRAKGEGAGVPAFNTGDPYRDMTLKALYEGYLDRWERDDDERFEKVAAEVYFEAPLMNPETGGISKTWVLAGKIDAIAREKATGKLYIIEHKTTSSDIGPGSDYWRRLAIDGQVSGYYVGAQANGYEVENCLYDVIRKPTMYPSKSIPMLDEEGLKIVVDEETGERVMKKDGTPRQSAGEGMKLLVRDETPEEWYKRLELDILQRPDYYYARVEVARSADDLTDYLFDMWAVGREIADAQRLGRFSRNPQNCQSYGKCEFFDVCSGCADIDDVTLFRNAEDPNEELTNN